MVLSEVEDHDSVPSPTAHGVGKKQNSLFAD